jgi:hypothetical protein
VRPPLWRRIAWSVSLGIGGVAALAVAAALFRMWLG